jgi:hypothetical protein
VETPVSEDARAVFVEVSVIGVDHFKEWGLSCRDYTTNYSTGDRSLHEISTPNVAGTIERVSDANFAGRILLICDHLESDVKLNIEIEQCGRTNELHPISVNSYGIQTESANVLRHVVFREGSKPAGYKFERGSFSSWGYKGTPEEYLESAHLLSSPAAVSKLVITVKANGSFTVASDAELGGESRKEAITKIESSLVPKGI